MSSLLGNKPISTAELPALIRANSRRSASVRTSQMAYGQPWVWLFGGTLIICLTMIVGLLFIIFRYGLPTFWPSPIIAITTVDGKQIMGEVVRDESYQPDPEVIRKLPETAQPAALQYLNDHDGKAHRQLIRTGNFEITQSYHQWVNDFETNQTELPEWALLIERTENQGRFYGLIHKFMDGNKEITDKPDEAWRLYQEHHHSIVELVSQIEYLNKHKLGALNHQLKKAEVKVKEQEIRFGDGSPQHVKAQADYQETIKVQHARQSEINQQLEELGGKSRRFSIICNTIQGITKEINLSEIVRAVPANQLSLSGKWGVYLSRWYEFITGEPRNSNTEGGVFPCIWGTLTMTIIMTIFVVPFGVLAALYLREYAKPGLLVSTIRIAVNNLAGVPSIVFGVFGLGFFCYFLGGTIDQLFFPASKVFGPTYGTGGLLWASLTLALLTVPVVIVATEEALAAVPRSMREGSYACGASKWQTIFRIVLPRALPGILTGMILAMARGAGEVAPLMLVGAMKIAPELPVDSVFPYVHPERSFMHMGFHIYDVGFQSPDSEAAKPMVFTTTLLLILLIALLNLSAMWLRNRLRRKYLVSQF